MKLGYDRLNFKMSNQQQIFFILVGLVCLTLSLFIDKWSYALSWFGWGFLAGGFLSLYRKRF